MIVKEELKIPEALGNISELLWWDAFLCSKEAQLMTDQAMVRGELEISVLYTTEESDTQVYCLQQRIPFSGMLDGPVSYTHLSEPGLGPSRRRL